MIQKNNRGIAMMITIVLFSLMMVIAIGATDILNKGLQSSSISGRSIVAYLAAESGAERILWYAANYDKSAFEGEFNNCVAGAYVTIDGTDTTAFDCIAPSNPPQDHLIDLSNSDYYYQVRYKIESPFHVYESIGNFAGARRSVEIKYAK